MTDWIRSLSARETNPHQAGAAYMSRAIRVARVTSCKDSPVRDNDNVHLLLLLLFIIIIIIIIKAIYIAQDR